MNINLLKSLLLGSLFYTTTTVCAADYIYAPQSADSGLTEDSILVREVVVKKGDSLSMLSRQYSDKGYYYPQILLFNKIHNPDRIYVGQVLKVPVASSAGKPAVLKQTPRIKHKKNRADTSLRQPVLTSLEQPATRRHKTTDAPANSNSVAASKKMEQAENELYNQALVVFNQGDYTAAIKQFDVFINHYPASILVPEASLNRAECYLKLSAD
jgi:LysM repeat protein